MAHLASSLLLLVGPCLALVQPTSLRNSALVFLKPHASTDALEEFLRGKLATAGVQVLDTGSKLADEIERDKLIDRHYGSLAKLAMDTDPETIALTPAASEAFASAYGVQWADATGSMLRNDAALSRLGVDGMELESLWRGGVQVKLAPGTYISRLALPDDTLFTVNGFYPAMRQKFIEEGASIRYFVCDFDEAQLSWAAFRREVIGATNPKDALPGSARAELLEKWRELGLDEEPTQGLNGVHASAGPLEGLKERCVWTGATIESDGFGAQLLAAGVDRDTLMEWLEDNPVMTMGGSTDKVFDLTEELGTDEVLAMCANAAS